MSELRDLSVWRDDESGAALIDFTGIIVARVPYIVEQKWPGITKALAEATERHITSLDKTTG